MKKKIKKATVKGNKRDLMVRVFNQLGANPNRRLSLRKIIISHGYEISNQSVQQFSEAMSSRGKEKARLIKDLPVTWKIIDILSKKIKELEAAAEATSDPKEA